MRGRCSPANKEEKLKSRRILAIAIALGVFGIAGVAYAASLNTYTAKFTFTSKKAGTAKKPVPIGFTQDLTAKSSTAGNRTAVLLDLKTTMYGVKVSPAGFPTCSLSKIAAAKNDTGCPKGAEVATGSITALVGPETDFTNAGAPCNPFLHVWNGGGGKLTFFFVDTTGQTPHSCLGGALTTGSVGPYPGTLKKSGPNLVLNVPIPTYVDFPTTGFAGSLTGEHLKWAKLTRTVKGKPVGFFSSVGCKSGKRPLSQAFTATASQTGPQQTSTVKSTVPCSK
jgi:hypothetical protein